MIADLAPAAVLFDLFGVIALDQTPQARHAVEQAACPDPAAQAEPFWDAYWELRQDLDRGDLTTAAYWHAVAARCDLPMDAERTRRLAALDLDSWTRLDPAVLALIDRLAASGVRVGLLSNICQDLAALLADRHPSLFGRFDVLGLSCHLRHAKPEPEAYLWCARQFALTPDQILFVDDREANVKAARTTGMRGHHYTALPSLEALLVTGGPQAQGR